MASRPLKTGLPADVSKYILDTQKDNSQKKE